MRHIRQFYPLLLAFSVFGLGDCGAMELDNSAKKPTFAFRLAQLASTKQPLPAALKSASQEKKESAFSLDSVLKLIKEHHYKQAENSLTRMLNEKPDDANVQQTYGLLLRETGQIDKAMASYARAAELDSSSEVPLIALSELALKQLDLDSSLSYAQQAVACNPHSIAARTALIEALLQSEQTSEAERQMKYIPEKDLKTPYMEMLQYRLMQKKGDFLSARRHLQAALDSTGNEVTVSLRLEQCELLETLGENTAAKHELEKILVGDPDLLDARLKLARLLETQFHDYAAALQNYNEALKIDPLSAAAIAGVERCQTKRQNLALQLKIYLRDFLNWVDAQSQAGDKK